MKHSSVSRAKAALLSLGALSALAELLLLREVLFLAGGTELAAAVMLAAWLLAGAGGSFFASRARRPLSPGLLLASCAALFPIQVFALRLIRGCLAGPAGELPSVFALLFLGALASAPLPALLGAIFPAAAGRLGKAGAARAYALDAAGMAAGAGLTLALSALRQEYLAVALLASLFGTCGALILEKRLLAALAFAPLVLAILSPWAALERASTSFAFRLPSVESLVSTPHGRAFAARAGGHTHIYSGGLSDVELADANETVELVLAAAGNAKDVLIICNDPQGYALTLGTFPLVSGTILAPDPGLLRFRKRARPFETPPNVAVIAAEPLQHLRASGPRRDIVILTAGAPLTAQNNRLFTLGFFELVRARLAPGGLFAIELPYAPGHISEDLASLSGSVYQTLGQVFKARRVALTRYGASLILLASDDPQLPSIAPSPAPGRAEARKVLGLYAPVDFRDAYEGTRTRLARNMLEGRTWPPNTVTAPACYRLAISYSQRRFGPPGVLAWLWRLSLWHWLGAACAAGALFFVLALVRRGGWAPASGALGGGFCSMVVQVVIIYVFQSAHGLLYSHVGMLSGAFMLGALAGARACRNCRRALLALALLASLSLYAGALPFLLGAFAASGHFASLYLAYPAACAIAGILTGALFPACANLAGRPSAGRIYAADLAGASAGALLAGLVLVPSLGLHAAAFTACAGGLLLALPMLPAIIARKG